MLQFHGPTKDWTRINRNKEFIITKIMILKQRKLVGSLNKLSENVLKVVKFVNAVN